MTQITSIIFVLVATAFMSFSSQAKNCDDDSIDEVKGDGEIIKTISGHIYEIDSSDTVDSSLWLTAEDVLVCKDKSGVIEIINTDESGEKVFATLLK